MKRVLRVGLVVLTLALWTNSAYSESPKMALVEIFNTADADGAITQTNAFYRYLSNPNVTSKVIPINLHIPIGTNNAGDAVYRATNQPGISRLGRYFDYYTRNFPTSTGQSGFFVPLAFVDGQPRPSGQSAFSYQGAPADTNGINEYVESLEGRMSPYTITVTQTITGGRLNANVSVQSDVAINNSVRLRMMVVERYRYFRDGAGLSGENELQYIGRAQLGGNLDTAGFDATMTAGQTRQFTGTWNILTGANAIDPEFLYVVAWLESVPNFEVLQAGTNLVDAFIGGGFEAPIFYTVERGASQKKNVVILNPYETERRVRVSVDSIAYPLPTGWRVTFSETEVDVPAASGEEAGRAEVEVTLTLPATNGAYAPIGVKLQSITNGVDIPNTYLFAAMSANTKYVLYANNAASRTVYETAIKKWPEYGNELAFMPLNAGTVAAYPPQEFEIGIFHMGNLPIDIESNRGFEPFLYADAMNEQLNAGRKILLVGSDVLAWAFDDPNSNLPGLGQTIKAQEFLSSTLGVEYNRRVQRFTPATQTTDGFPNRFTVRGVPNDELINGWNTNREAAVNTPTTIANPTLYTDVISPKDDPSVVPFLFFDNRQEDVAGVRVTKGNGARAVYMSFNIESINSTPQREDLLRRAISWLDGKPLSADDYAEGSNGNVSLSVMPNPASENVTIQYNVNSALTGSLNVRIVDVMGQTVWTSEAIVPALGVNTVPVNVDSFATGTYRVIIDGNGAGVQVPLVVVR